MKLLQRKQLKSITLGETFLQSCSNITPRDIANVIVCLHDNTSLKELTIRIRTETKQSEVHLTSKYNFLLLVPVYGL